MAIPFPQHTLIRKADLEDKNYIEVRIGKHKKRAYKEDSVYFRPETFLMFEGTIWTQYREYSVDRYNVIATNEWIRIADELRTVATRIREASDPDVVKTALRVRHHDLLPDYADFPHFQEELAGLFEAFADWIKEATKEADHLSICV